MTYDEFNQFCGSLPVTTHVVQWGNSQVWKVGGKLFAVGGWNKDGAPAFTFKTSDLNYEFLRNKEGYRPAPYLASRGMKWIQQFEGTKDLDEELKYYIEESYRIVSLGLTKKKQKELGLNQVAPEVT
ncbi:MAG: MmcQ/YjbR family DNA-binding protein [Marinomonas sp.]|uniref:MmcQ/YjbR family DNA-binding protein n=1 Tax=Marinomonas sp. GJ51-6 TaxID=2992802 RepID=UPI0029347E85|nr:MmcQ/YjbR family DNA-binding protein [Marinomonas sp. GJ51-6]WOD07643.1 MmcQ/YjbR family DNA-binding protein [Marinomonas sp. GJ51-6]